MAEKESPKIRGGAASNEWKADITPADIGRAVARFKRSYARDYPVLKKAISAEVDDKGGDTP